MRLLQRELLRTRYVLSPERTFGTKLPDGSWTGMVGMVVREICNDIVYNDPFYQEADFATGPFITTLVRKQAADLSTTFYHGNVRIVSGLAGLRVDLWGFLLPLTPHVWTATLAALLGVLGALQVFSSCMPNRAYKTLCQDSWSSNTFSSVRVLLQQGEAPDTVLGLPAGLPCVLNVSVLSGSSSRVLMKTNSPHPITPTQTWCGPRRGWSLVLGLWMVTVLVLAKSYAGNLMSLLAVRYVPQPFQTLRNVLDHPSVAMIWQKFSSYEQFIRDVKHGQFREVAELEDKGRLLFHTQQEMREGLDTLVRRGRHVLIDVDINLKSRQCDFYISRDGFLPLSSAMMTQKTNPLVHGFNKRFHTAKDQGLITYWMENVPNFTQCENIPKKMVVNSNIFLHNIWGMFAVLAGGLAAGVLVLCTEVLLCFLNIMAVVKLRVDHFTTWASCTLSTRADYSSMERELRDSRQLETDRLRQERGGESTFRTAQTPAHQGSDKPRKRQQRQQTC
ncbi:LOW QUALITY PROTEIN: glutamate receptor ionotropic, kainate 5-like [Portunus trituberculatus]|uniref:LOW QUALITY PROTEIN: glutamate receptor ionotropic, kainate 5-like n=1 Tax=Portunus trituberculatus TaxID=210409 RepID=UPI001E1CDDF4|nr:LOW QUALITY PROTEIN: glutamate receptor ionotropic, kainate 5-like [Portunus trituberculatus]